MARLHTIGRTLLALCLLWLGYRHLAWSGYWLMFVGFDLTAPQHTAAHLLGLCSGVVASGAAWLTWQRRAAAIAAVWTLAALALANVTLQVLLSESARQAWAQQWPLKLLFEAGFWVLALGFLYRARRSGSLTR